MPKKILFVVNKSKGEFGPSETFLKAHLDGMRSETIPLVGMPGRRAILKGATKKFLQRQDLPSRIFRKLLRILTNNSIEKQDVKAVAELIRYEEVDFVFAEYGPTGVSVMGACEISKVPLVVHFHGWDAYTDYNMDTYGRKYKDMFNISAAVIAVSNHMKNQLVALGCPSDKIFVNPCGADLPEGLFAKPYEQPPRFIMVGRLTHKKAPLLSIKAFSRVLETIPDASLVIIGDGPLREDCERLIMGLGIESKVDMRGAQPHELVIESLLSARCFIQHSVTASDGDREGTPVSVMEAMGLGLPVVSTYHGGICDLVTNGVTGIMVEEMDEDGMVAGMLKFALDNDFAGQVGKAAREEVLSGWTSKRSLERLWQIIQETA